jgi:hypothetical protein
MARAKPERARSKTLAIDDLTYSIEQLQSFIPKFEDLGREGFPYLEGALARTELQLRECIKRGFGEKSPEFQSHRHLKLALSTSAEKKQTLTLLRGLIASLEEKKLELQGIKPAAVEGSSPASNAPQLTLVPPVVSTAHVSVTSVSSSAAHPTSTTLPLVPTVEPPAVQAPSTAASPAVTSLIPGVAESAPSIPPRGPIEPISSLFRTQETKPVPSVSQPRPQDSAAVSPSPAAAAAAPAVLSVSSSPAPVAIAPCAPSVVDTMPLMKTASPSMTAPPPACSGPASAAHSTQPAAAAFSTTQEVPVAPAAIPVPSIASAPVQGTGLENDHLSTAKLLCHRFHAVARQLRLRGEYRSTISVDDEFDVQDLVHALLRQHFDDIGTDEWTPSYSNSTTRTCFLLDHDRLTIVVKKTRPGLSRKDLADQVRVDAERYRDRGRCTQLLCFIYDPDGRVGNPRGLESELTTISDHFTVEVIVAPK